MNQSTHLTENISINIKNQLGKGATGTVYQGIYQTKQMEKPISIAIKTINMNTITNQVTKYLLNCQIASLKTLAKSKNPYIVHLYDVIEKDNIVYIVMERLFGKTLRDFLNEHKDNLTQETTIEIFQKIVQGYSSLSDNRIIHRDLKPENIIFRNNNTLEPCLIDFGYCINPKVKEIPKVFYNVGSPKYMAPQAYQKNIYSEKSDVWALGIIFYEMLVGKTFDEGIQISKCQQNIAKTGIPYPLGFKPELMKFLNSVLNINIMKRLNFQELRNAIHNDFALQEHQPLINQQIKNQLSYQNVRSRTEKKHQNSIMDRNMHHTPQRIKKINFGYRSQEQKEFEESIQPQILGKKIKSHAQKRIINQKMPTYQRNAIQVNQSIPAQPIISEAKANILAKIQKPQISSNINVKFVNNTNSPNRGYNLPENQQLEKTNYNSLSHNAPKINFHIIDNAELKLNKNQFIDNCIGNTAHEHKNLTTKDSPKIIYFEKPAHYQHKQHNNQIKRGIRFIFENQGIKNPLPQKNTQQHKQTNKFKNISVNTFKQQQNNKIEKRKSFTKPNIHFVSNNHQEQILSNAISGKDFHPKKPFVTFN